MRAQSRNHKKSRLRGTHRVADGWVSTFPASTGFPMSVDPDWILEESQLLLRLIYEPLISGGFDVSNSYPMVAENAFPRFSLELP